MTEHPVVACYRGLDSADAVQLGARLASALQEPLALACTYRYEPAAHSARALPAPDNERRADAARTALQRARLFVPGDVDLREAVIASTDVAGGLVELACDLDASMLVLGRDTEGHVTRSVVPRAPCPVAVAPLSVPLPQTGPIARIGVAYDGSPQAHWALVAAARLARAMGAELAVLTTAPSAERAATPLHSARVTLERDMPSFDSRVLIGDPRAALADASAGVDLLLCGSRGRRHPLSAVLGSVSAHLIAHARCPVVVVPPSVYGDPAGALGLTSAAVNREP
jgi:nucleotide-binding universal stress UspA family protein